MDQRLTLGNKFHYGLADMGFALITSAMQFFLLFYYTDVAMIDSVLAGLALMVGKLTWDAVMGNKPPAHWTPIKGLWFIGAQSESTGGVLNVMIGAKKVANTILAGK